MTGNRLFSRRDLARLAGGKLASEADADRRHLRGVAALHEASPDQFTWLASEKFVPLLQSTRASAVLGPAKLLQSDPRAILVDDTEAALADLLAHLQPPPDAPAPGVHPSAIVAPSAALGADVAIGAFAIIKANARIGDRTIIHEGVSIGAGVDIGADSIIHDRAVIYDRCSLGNRVILHAGSIIGADGFGYIFRNGGHRRIPHIGTVLIEDDVEIGANACIDRAKVGTTRIGRGTKIDNLVMIAHNVQIGPLCILAAQTGIAGSAILGSAVIAAGQVGVVDGVRIGDQARLAAQAVAIADLEGGRTYLGYPAQDRRDELKQWVRIRQLPDLFHQVLQLEQRISRLESSTHHPKAD